MEKKRSLKYLLVSVCLALLLASIGGVIAGAADSVNEDPSLVIKGASLDLNSKLGIAFAVDSNVWDENLQLKLYYDNNPGATDVAADETLDVDDVLAETVVKGGTEYKVIVSDGFAPTDVHTTVYARLYNTDNGNYGPIIKTGVLELVHVMKEQVESKTELTDDEKEVRLGLYNAIIAYEAATRKNILPADNELADAEFHLVKVEDGYIVDGDLKYTYGLFAEGEKVALSVNDDIPAKLADHASKTGEQYSVLGWSDNGALGVDNSTAAAAVVKGAVTYSPVFARTDKFVKSNDKSASTQVLASSNASVAASGLLWTDLNEEVAQYYGIKSFEDATLVTNAGGFTYDAAKNAIAFSGNGKFATTTTYANVIFGNPAQGQNNLPQSTVIDFNICIPSVDNDGDGKYNEVDGDLHYIADGQSGLFNILVAYERDNLITTSNSEKLFRLAINADTGNEAKSAVGWSLNSSANVYDAISYGVSGKFANMSNLNDNGFFATNNVFDKVTTYEFDREYNIKLVLSSRFVTVTDPSGSTRTVIGLDRVDIYVDDVLHHSRIVGAEIKSGGTDTYGDVSLGFAGTFQAENFDKHSGGDHFAARHTGSPYILLGVGTGNYCIATLEMSDPQSYTTSLTPFDGECINTNGGYVHANHGTANLAKMRFTYDELEAALTTVKNGSQLNLINYQLDGSTPTVTWNDLPNINFLYSRDTAKAMGADPAQTATNTKATYANKMLSITTDKDATNNGHIVPIYVANPLQGLAGNYNGEVLVFEFRVQLPSQDTNGNGTLNQYNDFIKTGSSVYSEFMFGFNGNWEMQHDASKLVWLQMQLQGNAGSADNPDVMNTYGIRDNGNGDVPSDKVNIGEWLQIKFVVVPNANGTVNYVDTYLNGKWNRRYDNGGTTTGSVLAAFDKNLFNQPYCGIVFQNIVFRIGTVNLMDFNCYLIR